MKKVYMKEVGIKKRNPIARALKFFTQKIIRDKTKYRRKEKHALRNRSFWEID